MGMFDRFIHQDGTEWQTKAFDNDLADYQAGDPVPELECHRDLRDYQVEIYRYCYLRLQLIDSFATVRGGLVTLIDVPRDKTLPRVSCDGYQYHPDAEAELEERKSNGQ